MFAVCSRLPLFCVFPPRAAVMEVACGEYGDNVPKLVVALKTGQARHFQSYTSKKPVNVKVTPEVKQINDSAYDSDGCVGSHTAGLSLLTNLDLKETAILDDNLSDCESSSILSGGGGAGGALAHAHAHSTRAAGFKSSTPMVHASAHAQLQGHSSSRQPPPAADTTVTMNTLNGTCDTLVCNDSKDVNKSKSEKDAKETEVCTAISHVVYYCRC